MKRVESYNVYYVAGSGRAVLHLTGIPNPVDTGWIQGADFGPIVTMLATGHAWYDTANKCFGLQQSGGALSFNSLT